MKPSIEILSVQFHKLPVTIKDSVNYDNICCANTLNIYNRVQLERHQLLKRSTSLFKSLQTEAKKTRNSFQSNQKSKTRPTSLKENLITRSQQFITIRYSVIGHYINFYHFGEVLVRRRRSCLPGCVPCTTQEFSSKIVIFIYEIIKFDVSSKEIYQKRYLKKTS